MKILIVEDDPFYASQIEMLLERMGYDPAGVCDNGFDALDFFHRMAPDLLLMDINIAGDVDGIEVARRINAVRPVPVVFITSMQDNATFERAQAILPAAFILKPFDALQLQRTIELAISTMNADHTAGNFEDQDMVLRDCLFIKVRNKLEKVLFDDILYVESDGRHTILHTLSNRKFVVRMPLNEMETKLPPNLFTRTHRSYLIHLKWLQSVDLQNMLIQVKDKKVPLSKSFRKSILERFEQI